MVYGKHRLSIEQFHLIELILAGRAESGESKLASFTDCLVEVACIQPPVQSNDAAGQVIRMRLDVRVGLLRKGVSRANGARYGKRVLEEPNS
jgi:hypothetical protein